MLRLSTEMIDAIDAVKSEGESRANLIRVAIASVWSFSAARALCSKPCGELGAGKGVVG
jgi:hypothetical protein